MSAITKQQKNYRHKRALFRATLVACIFSGPAFYLSLLYHNDLIRDVREEGVIEKFVYSNDEDQTFFNSGQTFERVSLVIVARGMTSVSQESLNSLDQLGSWVNSQFTDRVNTHSGPRELARIVVADSPDVAKALGETLRPYGFDVFTSSVVDAVLPTSVRSTGTGVWSVVITQESRYGGAISFQDKYFQEKTRRLLSKYVVDNYLFHFMTEQALMFKKASRYAKGDPVEEINKMEKK